MGSSVSENLFAALDIGSHTTRMLIVQKSGSELVAVRADRRVTRLAAGFQRSGMLTEEAQCRNLEALKEYVGILRGYKVEKDLLRGDGSGEAGGKFRSSAGANGRRNGGQVHGFIGAKRGEAFGKGHP